MDLKRNFFNSPKPLVFAFMLNFLELEKILSFEHPIHLPFLPLPSMPFYDMFEDFDVNIPTPGS
jgi:hypothetical protein